MNDNKLSRKERAQITRQKLVDAALDLFFERGYDNVTVDDICEKAGVSKGAFYGHFKSKDQAVVEEFLKVDDYYQEMLPQILQEKSYVDKGIAFVRLALRYIASQGEMVIKVAYSSQISPGRKASPVASRDRALYLLAEGLIREAQEAGEVRKDLDSAEIASVLIRAIRGTVYDWCLQDGGFDLEAAAIPLASVLTDGLLPR
jgi:AcrR family transcriptional regulator